MEQSILTALEALEKLERVGATKGSVRHILMDFYKDRTIEILMHLDSQGVGELVGRDTKIGLTD